MKANKKNKATLIGLLDVLKEANFLYRVRTRDEVIEGRVINRKMI